MAKFINAWSWEEIVFTHNTTYAINMVALGLGLKLLKPGDEILVTVMEHHSNMLPWRTVARLTGAKVKYLDITDEGYLRYDQLEEMITEKTKIVAVTIMSNVIGTINDVKRIVREAKKVGAIVVADGAQGVPHLPVDVRDLGVDFLAFSGHKMLGPTGIGVLWGRKDILEQVEPVIAGGGAIKDVTLESVEWANLPWRLEPGTPNIAGAIGLAAAVEYLERLGMENVRAHEKELVAYTIKLFEEELAGIVDFYGPRNPEHRGGVIAFNMRGLHYHTVGRALDTFGIAVRTGMHCAHPLHYRLGLRGTVRASYYIYNTKEEVEALVDALKKIHKMKDILTATEADYCTAG
ncbi:cysteine desulfurase [Hyperthermus butylicus]|uniref:aminotransferase class V-fold PLP-dependent enzyme n=1 Tax=Hyperthermus butylicus TaxID=54248 RepID=UPI000A57C67B